VDRLTAEDFRLPGAHAGPDALASYVIGALTASEAEELEAHVFACDACSEALAREARLERALDLVVEDLPPEPLAIPVRAPARVASVTRLPRAAKGRWGGVVGAVAIAASALLWLGPGGHLRLASDLAPATGAARPAQATNPDAADAHASVESQADAQAQILFAHDLDGG
jgi:anti-sigma factor RsiW